MGRNFGLRRFSLPSNCASSWGPTTLAPLVQGALFCAWSCSDMKLIAYLRFQTSATVPSWCVESFFSFQCHHMSLMDLVVSPSGCGRSETDFWGWEADEARLRCPDEVDGDIWIWSTRRGLKPKFYQTTQTMVTMGIFPFKEKSPW
jgi:hypothetical protein